MTRLFPTLLILLALIGGTLFALGKDAIQINRQGDAALFEQVTGNIHAGRGPVSNVFANTQNYIDHVYFGLTPAQLATQDLQPPAAPERNLMAFHAYYILYLIAPWLTVMSASLALALLQSLCFFGLLAAAGCFVYRRTQSAVAATLFAAILAMNPNWIGALSGQFYPDRIFILAGFLLAWLSWRQSPAWLLALGAVLTATINERAALIGGIILILIPFCRGDIFPLVLQRLRPARGMIASIAIGLALLAYAWVQKTYVLTNAYYDSFLPHDLQGVMTMLRLPGFIDHIGLLLTASAALLALTLVDPRLTLLALVVIMPNIIGNIGGGEKIGWSTHYHSYYLPIVAFAAAAGFVKLHEILRLRLNRPILGALGLALLLFAFDTTAYVSDVTGFTGWPTANQSVKSIAPRLTGKPTGIDIRQDAAALFPADATVSMGELGMALLFDHVRVGTFPVGLAQADFVFLPCAAFEADKPADSPWQPYTQGWFAAHGFDATKTVRLPAIDHCRIDKIAR